MKLLNILQFLLLSNIDTKDPNGDGVIGSGELLRPRKDGIPVFGDKEEQEEEDAEIGDGDVEDGEDGDMDGDHGGLLIKLENIDGIMESKD